MFCPVSKEISSIVVFFAHGFFPHARWMSLEAELQVCCIFERNGAFLAQVSVRTPGKSGRRWEMFGKVRVCRLIGD